MQFMVTSQFATVLPRHNRVPRSYPIARFSISRISQNVLTFGVLTTYQIYILSKIATRPLHGTEVRSTRPWCRSFRSSPYQRCASVLPIFTRRMQPDSVFGTRVLSGRGCGVDEEAAYKLFEATRDLL